MTDHNSDPRTTATTESTGPNITAPPRTFTRRTLLTGAGAGLAGLTLAACSGPNTRTTPSGPTPNGPSPSGSARTAPAGQDLAAAIRQREAQRPHTGRTRSYTLRPQTTEVDLGGPTVRTLAYGDTIPGQLIRADVGDELAVTVHNALEQATSVHWHGIALRNDMDGAAPATSDIASGDAFTYRFSVPDPGTYWAHPHTGIAITDYGLYLPIIIDDPKEPAGYDTEWIVVLDDWTDGVGPSPQQILDKLEAGGMPGMSGMSSMPGMSAMGGMDHGGMSGMDSMGSSVPTSSSAGVSGTAGATGMDGMSGMDGAGSSELLGGDAGDVSYPYYLINGRIPAAPTTFAAKPGQRIRIRIINAGADTAFRVALAGHRLTVTHTDGYPVQPRQVDALLLGMGERYDVIVTAESGVFPLVALAEGKNGAARALLRTAPGSAPDPSARPGELNGRVGTVEAFTATDQAALAFRRPDLQLAAVLGGDMKTYRWTINGRTFDQLEPLSVTQGQRARLTFTNNTMMWHPMHLHGHTFQIIRNDRRPGPRKDTVIVLPMKSLAVDVQADNPGDWMLHCHNGYHMDAGMMTRLDYRI